MSGYSFLRGVFVALAICTLAVTGLTVIHGGFTPDVVVALGAAVGLYLVTEWYMPKSERSGHPKDLVDVDDADQGHDKERERGSAHRSQAE